MAAGILHLTIEKGATYQKTLIWQDSTGTAIDLTGYTARMQIRENVKSDTTLVSLTSDPSGGITITELEGKIEIEIDADTTSAIIASYGVYDLEMIDAEDKVTRLVKGNVSFDDEVTR